MSNNKKYIALSGGETCKPVNPYDKETQYYEWYGFNSSDESFALTEVMPEGEFEGEQVERYRAYHSKMWHFLDRNNQHWKNVTIKSGDRCKNNGIFYEYQIAIKPLKAIEPVKEETLSLIPEELFVVVNWVSMDIRHIYLNREQATNVCNLNPIGSYVVLQISEYLESILSWYRPEYDNPQTISAEGIVSFVLEWVAERTNYDTDFILGMKDNIIKELKN